MTTTKLITTVQYEPKLEACNQLRPLTIADTVQNVIDFPVLDRNPVTGDKQIGRGKCLPCSNHGAMAVRHNHKNPMVWYPIDMSIRYGPVVMVDLQFEVVLFGILWVDNNESWSCNLTTPTGINIEYLSRTEITWFYIKARYIWFVNDDYPGSDWTGIIYRFVEV